jgi:hypothetical protein
MAQLQGTSADNDSWEEQKGPRVSFLLLWQAIWAARRLVAASIVAAVFLAIAYLAVRTPIYTATAMIAPPSNGSQLPSGGLGSALSAAAGLGISFGGSDDEFGKYLQVLKSTRLAAMLEADPAVMAKLFAVRWNSATGSWEPPPGSFPAWKNSVKRALGMRITPFTAKTVTDWLDRSIGLANAPSTGGLTMALRTQITVVSLSYKDRPFATDLLNRILDDADILLRQEKLSNAANRIAYLNAQIKQTTDVNLSNSLREILMSQERELMILKADRHYAVDVIDPPASSPKPSGASTLMVLSGAVILGLAAAVAAIFLILRARLGDAGSGRAPLDAPFPNPFRPASWSTWPRQPPPARR